MELIRSVSLSAEKWVNRSNAALFSLGAIVTCWIWLNFSLGYSVTPQPISNLPNPAKSLIGEGSLSLSRTSSSLSEPLLNEIILVGASTRPDQDHDRICTFALRSSGEKRTISIGETLSFTQKEGKVMFSDAKTELSMTPLSLEESLLACKIDNNNTSEFCFLSASSIFSQPLEKEPFTTIFQQSAVWGKDVFLTGWGGDEYREMLNRVKVSIGPDVYFLKTGDLLWWDGQMWVQELQTNTMGPVAQVTKAGINGIDIQIWDVSGFSSQTVHVGIQTPPKSSLNVGELITAIRPRTPTEITCQLGKRRVIVREGDWWIRSDDRWRAVRTASDLEACLHHQIPGELFIFEKVEASKGNVTLEGRVFDSMRTSSEPVSLVLQTEKKPSIGSKKPSTGSPHLAKNRSHRSIHKTQVTSAMSENSKEKGEL